MDKQADSSVTPPPPPLDWAKFKAFAVDKLNVTKMIISVFDQLENTVKKREKAGFNHFLCFPHCLQKASYGH